MKWLIVNYLFCYHAVHSCTVCVDLSSRLGINHPCLHSYEVSSCAVCVDLPPWLGINHLFLHSHLKPLHILCDKQSLVVRHWNTKLMLLYLYFMNLYYSSFILQLFHELMFISIYTRWSTLVLWHNSWWCCYNEDFFLKHKILQIYQNYR